MAVAIKMELGCCGLILFVVVSNRYIDWLLLTVLLYCGHIGNIILQSLTDPRTVDWQKQWLFCVNCLVLGSAVSCNDVLQFYVGVIRPVLQYAVAAWLTSLSLEMSDQLELLQKRVLHIIYGGSHFISDSYASYCAELGIETLRVRRDLIARRFSSDPRANQLLASSDTSQMHMFTNCET